MTLARVAAMTGIPPAQLEELDGPLWRALVEAVDTRWSQVEEMLTFQAELLYELIRVTLHIHTKEGARGLRPLHLDRPWHVTQQATTSTGVVRRSSPQELAAFTRQLGGARVE